MGGRGARSGGAGGGGGGGGLGGGPLLGGGGIGAQAPPQVVPGQPVPAVTMQQLQSMTGQEFADYLNGLKSTPIDPNIYYNHDWDTQRLIANMPELNKAPQVVDAKTFASLPGESLYRTVNASGADSAVDVCARTMMSDVTTIGGGVIGDGFYFANSKSVSQVGYGNTKNNINKTATMVAKLNGNARVVTNTQLTSMLSQEPQSVRTAISRTNGGWGGTNSGMMSYALYKGYNVVSNSGGSVLNIIDRSAVTWSGDVIPYR